MEQSRNSKINQSLVKYGFLISKSQFLIWFLANRQVFCIKLFKIFGLINYGISINNSSKGLKNIQLSLIYGRLIQKKGIEF